MRVAGPRIDDPRDLREFVDAKRIKREPIRIKTAARGAGVFFPRDRAAFVSMIARLRENPDWGRAMERIATLEDALRRRHGCHLPTPRKLYQNPDFSISITWEGYTIFCHPDVFGSHFDGKFPTRMITTSLLDALGHLAKIQSAA